MTPVRRTYTSPTEAAPLTDPTLTTPMTHALRAIEQAMLSQQTTDALALGMVEGIVAELDPPDAERDWVVDEARRIVAAELRRTALRLRPAPT